MSKSEMIRRIDTDAGDILEDLPLQDIYDLIGNPDNAVDYKDKWERTQEWLVRAQEWQDRLAQFATQLAREAQRLTHLEQALNRLTNSHYTLQQERDQFKGECGRLRSHIAELEAENERLRFELAAWAYLETGESKDE